MLCLLTGGLLVSGGFIFAQEAGDALTTVGSVAGFPADSLPVILAKIVRAALGVIGIVLVLLIMYAGWLYLSAAGDSDKVDRAKRLLTQAAIGTAIIFSAFAITQFVLNGLLSGLFGSGGAGLGGGLSATQRFSEPRSGSLGAGIIEDHYPGRGALDVPRNASIFITFKEPINPASFIEGYVNGADVPEVALNADNVYIYPTNDGPDARLSGTDVRVSVDDAGKTLVLDPVELLGSLQEDTNYTVDLRPTIELADGSAAFTGRFGQGYAWTFEVSTDVDVTPPTVVSVQPAEGRSAPRNTAVQMTFSEPMHPLSVSGVTLGAGSFSNIQITSADTSIPGTFSLSNNYRTVTFVSSDACAQDACGSVVYCLPSGETIDAVIHAATVSDTAPQAVFANGRFDGAVDASGNSLDGNQNFSAGAAQATAEGRPADDVTWRFTTSATIDERTPRIERISPELEAEFVNPDAPVEIAFTMPMLASSITSSSVQLFPDTWYEFPSWITQETSADEGGVTTAFIHHRTLIPSDAEGGMTYWPLIASTVRGSNQFCMYPSDGPEAVDVGPGESCGTAELPYCCRGRASAVSCETSEGPLPYR